MSRSARLLRLAGWTTGVALALGALAASGQGALSPPPLGSPGRWHAWFEQRDPTSAAFAILRMFAVGGCWYLAATTALGAVLRLVRADILVAVADRFTVVPVRRLLAGTITLTLAGMGPTGMLAAAAQPVPSAPATSSTSGPPTSAVTPTSAPTGPTTPDTITMRQLPPAGPTSDPSPAKPPARSADRWTVQPGDCFWTIADDLLRQAWGRAPSDAEIVPFWQRLIETNRPALADPGNPHLIFPDQVFIVPPVPPGADAK